MANPSSFSNMKEIKNRTSIYQQRVSCEVENGFSFTLCLFYSCFTFRSRKNPFFLHRWWGGMEVLKVCTRVHYNFFSCEYHCENGMKRGEKMKSSCKEIHAPIKREQRNVKRISEFLFLRSRWWQSGFFSFPLEQIMNGTFSINYFTSSGRSLRPLITRSIYLRGDHK